MRALLIDDHALVRQGILQILLAEFADAQFGQAADAVEALAMVWHEAWDVVLLDITLPGRSGAEVLREIKKARPSVPVLILSMHPEDQFALRLLKSGASGYLSKESSARDLVGAVRKVLAGGIYLSAAMAEVLASTLSSDASTLPHERLSNREFEVLRAMTSGKTVGEVAQEFSLSVKTISTHRMRILKKMRMKTNAEMMRYAIQRRLVE